MFTLSICIKDIKEQFKVFITNKKVYGKYIITSYFKMFGIVLLCALPVVLLNGGEQSANQELINEMFRKNIISTFILSVLYAPLIEADAYKMYMTLHSLLNRTSLQSQTLHQKELLDILGLNILILNGDIVLIILWNLLLLENLERVVIIVFFLFL